jgi:hypothetical protein
MYVGEALEKSICCFISTDSLLSNISAVKANSMVNKEFEGHAGRHIRQLLFLLARSSSVFRRMPQIKCF